MGRGSFRRALATTTWHAHPARRARAYRFLQRSQWLSREELERVQLAALNDVLTAAREIPFYGARLEAAAIGPGGVQSLDEFARLPPLERADVQRLGIAALRRGRGVSILRKTSGSTGEPVHVVWPLEMMAWVDAAERRSRDWLGIRPGARRLVVHPVAADARLRTRLKRALRNTVRIDLGSVADRAACEALCKSLARNPPDFLIGSSPGALCELALALGDQWPFATRAIVTSGVRLHEHERALIERVFRCPVSERYGTLETGLLSHPCREGGAQHVPADVVLLEVVRDDGASAAPDEVGHVLVTCLRNRAMPLIRYRLGDLASLGSDACRCGRGLPVLTRLVGRTSERLVSAGGAIIATEVAVRAVLDVAEESLLEFKIVQQADRCVQLLVVQRDDPDPDAIRVRLAETFDLLVGLPGTTVVEQVTHIPLGPGGKLNVVVSDAVEP